jgi:hypothetical protein
MLAKISKNWWHSSWYAWITKGPTGSTSVLLWLVVSNLLTLKYCITLMQRAFNTCLVILRRKTYLQPGVQIWFQLHFQFSFTYIWKSPTFWKVNFSPIFLNNGRKYIVSPCENKRLRSENLKYTAVCVCWSGKVAGLLWPRPFLNKLSNAL